MSNRPTQPSAEERIIRWATKGRRQPTLIGRDSSGKKIWGGPYTIYQGVTLLIVGGGGWHTRHIWAANMPGPSLLLLLAAATAGAVFLVGRIDFSARNPVWWVAGLLHCVRVVITVSATHSIGGTSRHVKKPYTVRCQAITTVEPVPRVPPETDGTTADTTTTTPVGHTGSPAVTAENTTETANIAAGIADGNTPVDPVRAAMSKLAGPRS